EMEDPTLPELESDPKANVSGTNTSAGSLLHIDQHPLAPLPSQASIAPSKTCVVSASHSSTALCAETPSLHAQALTCQQTPILTLLHSWKQGTPSLATTCASTPAKLTHNHHAPSHSYVLPWSPLPCPTPSTPSCSKAPQPMISEMGTPMEAQNTFNDLNPPLTLPQNLLRFGSEDLPIMRESEVPAHIKHDCLMPPEGTPLMNEDTSATDDHIPPMDEEMDINVTVECGGIYGKFKYKPPKDRKQAKKAMQWAHTLLIIRPTWP
ncbi:hypothetical protein FRC11_003806, partial [Ceratobasidium sp. 423]